MLDILSAAIVHASQFSEADPETKWTITFTNNESRKGTLTLVANDVYLLHTAQRTYYITSAQVIYLNISDDQR